MSQSIKLYNGVLINLRFLVRDQYLKNHFQNTTSDLQLSEHHRSTISLNTKIDLSPYPASAKILMGFYFLAGNGDAPPILSTAPSPPKALLSRRNFCTYLHLLYLKF